MATDFEQISIASAAANGFYSEEAERSILGNIVFKYDRYGYFLSELVEDDFYTQEHKAILRAISAQRQRDLESTL